MENGLENKLLKTYINSSPCSAFNYSNILTQTYAIKSAKNTFNVFCSSMFVMMTRKKHTSYSVSLLLNNVDL